MKKLLLLSSLAIAFTVIGVGKVTSADSEATSGGLNASQLEKKGNMQARTVANVGGGTWTTMSNVNGNTISHYYHRDRKHSATVKGANGHYNKVVRPAGQWADASLRYVSGKNSVYWDNAPKEAVGNYSH